jgi:O-antigen/teichoic acid export membrane protein
MLPSLDGAPNAGLGGVSKGESKSVWDRWAARFNRVLGAHAWGWTDQAIVSATNFLVLIMLARWTDVSELGSFAIGNSVLALLLATQESLITRPYTIQLYRPLGTPAEHAFSTFLLSLALAAAATLILGGAGLALHAFGADRQAFAIALTLAAVAPFVLLREFARRFAFAHLTLFRVMLLDLGVALFTLLSLAWLGWMGKLSAATAFMAAGLSCGLGGLAWLYFTRRELAFRLGQVRPTLKQSWGLGKWLFCGQMAMQSQGYITYWLSLVIAGTMATGIYTACMSIVAFANPLLFGFYNILIPKSVRTLKTGGNAGLVRQAGLDAGLLAAVMSIFCLVIFFAGEPLMITLYHGPEYAGNGHILTVLTVSALAAAVGVPASIALASAERARAVAAVTAVSAVLSVVLVWLFMSRWGLLGAAYAVLIAEIIGSGGRWLAFLMLVAKPMKGAAAAQQPPELKPVCK